MPEQRCRMCGCTQDKACVDSQTKAACRWVAPDLCSACAADPEKRGKHLAGAAFDVALREFHRKYFANGEQQAAREVEEVAEFFFVRGVRVGQAILDQMADLFNQPNSEPLLILPGDAEFAESFLSPDLHGT